VEDQLKTPVATAQKQCAQISRRHSRFKKQGTSPKGWETSNLSIAQQNNCAKKERKVRRRKTRPPAYRKKKETSEKSGLVKSNDRKSRGFQREPIS